MTGKKGEEVVKEACQPETVEVEPDRSPSLPKPPKPPDEGPAMEDKSLRVELEGEWSSLASCQSRNGSVTG